MISSRAKFIENIVIPAAFGVGVVALVTLIWWAIQPTIHAQMVGCRDGYVLIQNYCVAGYQP